MVHLLARRSRPWHLQLMTICLASAAVLPVSASPLAGLKAPRASRGPRPAQSLRDASGHLWGRGGRLRHRLAGTAIAMLATAIAAVALVAETAGAQPVGSARRACHH